MDSDGPRFQLEALTANHAVSTFYCEDDQLNDYIRNEALADTQRHVANIFVEIDTANPVTENVAGFFALRAHALRIDENYRLYWHA